MLIGVQKQALRGPVNPLDKSTVFSIYPEQIFVQNHTVQPGRFLIEAGTYDKPGMLVVGPSSWWRNVDENQPPLEIPHSSVVMAESIVNDWSNGLLGCDMAENKPGLFWLPGELTVARLKTEYKSVLDNAKQCQDRWFNHLVRLADGFWARTNGNPLSISDQMRLAAKALNLTSKEWLSQNQSYEMVSCPACKTFIRDTVIICPTCKVIVKPEEFKKMNLSFAS